MRKLATAVAVSLAFASSGAVGLGLGDIEMRSALNQPMNAEIPLTSVQAGELDGMIVDLADENAFARAGIDRSATLADLRFAVEVSGGRPLVRITSARAVTEPFLNFLLEVDWPAGRMVREYTVLLDPPIFMTEGASVRDGAERRAVVDAESALVAPAPIERAAARTGDGFDVERVGAGDEITDDALIGRDDAGRLAQGADAASRPTGGEGVSLTDLEAPNTDAVAERTAATEASVPPDEGSDERFDVERIGAAEITVARGDTLSTLAEANAADGVSVQQMMLALLEANRSAFIDDNVNLVKAGSILRVPRAVEARALSQAQALAEIGRQDDLWRQYRDNLRDSTAATRLAGGPGDTAAPAPVDAGADAARDVAATVETESGLSEAARAILESAREEIRNREELSIVADAAVASTAASATADATEAGDTARLGEINRTLQLAREELTAARLEGGDLGERATELQSTSENLDALVSLRQNEIARLEAQLADARTGAGEAAQVAEIDTGATGTDVPGTDASTNDAPAGAENLLADVSRAGASSVADAANGVGSADAVAGEATGRAAERVGEASDAGLAKVAGAGEAMSSASREELENAVSAPGGTLADDELVGDGASGAPAADAAGASDSMPADGVMTAAAAANGALADGAAGGAVTDEPASAAAAAPWYRALLEDPMRLAIAGAGAVGLLGVLGTLLWSRRRREEDDPLDGFDDERAAFTDDESAELQAELRERSAADDAAASEGTGVAAAVGTAAAGGAVADAAIDSREETSGESLAPGVAIAASGDAGKDEGLDEDDTISEVDVYLAYGLHGQAEELLTRAIERDPEDTRYAEKLLQTYHAQGDAEGFRRVAADYHARFGGEANPAWSGIAETGRELQPREALFAATGDVGDGRFGNHFDSPSLDDADFLASAPAGAASSVNRDFDATEKALDLEDESALTERSIDPAFAFDEGDLEATGDFSQIARELAAERADEDGPESVGTIDFPAVDGATPHAEGAEPSDQVPLAEAPDTGSLEDALTLDELDLDGAAMAANDAGEFDRSDDELMLDFDEFSDGIDLDATALDDGDLLDDVRSRGSAFEELEISDLENEEALLDATGPVLDGADEMDTMMDLAKAYIDMGDKGSASSALGEIVKGGSPEQVSEAETLLRKIS